jgi:hypothetical protein
LALGRSVVVSVSLRFRPLLETVTTKSEEERTAEDVEEDEDEDLDWTHFLIWETRKAKLEEERSS